MEIRSHDRPRGRLLVFLPQSPTGPRVPILGILLYLSYWVLLGGTLLFCVGGGRGGRGGNTPWGRGGATQFSGGPKKASSTEAELRFEGEHREVAVTSCNLGYIKKKTQKSQSETLIRSSHDESPLKPFNYKVTWEVENTALEFCLVAFLQQQENVTWKRNLFSRTIRSFW